jgi:TATA-binding protein-associated factor Taf7
MTNSEVESRIALAERAFDLARDRVRELENALRGSENSLERSMVEYHRERLRTQIRRIEAELATARRDLSDSREALDEAWALRNSPENCGQTSLSAEDHDDA